MQGFNIVRTLCGVSLESPHTGGLLTVSRIQHNTRLHALSDQETAICPCYIQCGFSVMSQATNSTMPLHLFCALNSIA